MAQATNPRLATTPAADLAPLESALSASYPEVWRTFAACHFIGLRADPANAAMGDDHLVALAMRLTEILRSEFGGQQPYLPAGRAYDLSDRDREIYSAFNGRNLNALAKQYSMTPRNLRDILSAAAKEAFERRQGALFEGT